MKKVGIITFHSAYNYGSVLQAYATQEAINSLGYEAEIINYRLEEQKKVYSNLRFKYGYKELIKDLTLLPIYSKRNSKYKKFEDFIERKMNTSSICRTPEDVYNLYDEYEIAVSGSDQIWNKHSLELEHIDWNYMNPYLLKNFNGRKISYASSTANMSDEELKKIIPEIKKFQAVSMRERSSAKKISALAEMEVSSVLDPTFLLKKDDWIKKLNLNKTKGKFILYYSLGGLKRFKKIEKTLIEVAKNNNCKIFVVTPFCCVKKNEYFDPLADCGSIEFLNAIYNANSIITDSYHGTTLSVNFGKNVFSLCKKGGSEFRKTDILNRIGMKDRIITNPNDLVNKKFEKINYESVYENLDKLRNKSLCYLKNALEG